MFLITSVEIYSVGAEIRDEVNSNMIGGDNVTLLVELFFLASLLACKWSFASRLRLVYVPQEKWDVNKPTTRNTREANDYVHVKRLTT